MQTKSTSTTLDLRSVVAIGEGASRENGESNGNPGELEFLGHLLWYSVSETYVTREELLEALEDAGVDERFAPKPISERDAFRRATKTVELRRASLENGRYANVLVREVKANEGSLVRQVVREEVDAESVTLSYRPVAQLELAGAPLAGGEKLEVSLLSPPLLAAEEEVIERIKEAYEFERSHYDSRAVRRLILTILREATPVSLKNSGGLYFVSREHDDVLRSVVRLVEELRDRDLSRQKSGVMAVPLVDREEYREVLAENLDEQVERESKALIREMSEIIKGGKRITRRRQSEYVGRVRGLSEAVGRYEELLKTGIASAQANLDLAMRGAVELLGRVEVK